MDYRIPAGLALLCLPLAAGVSTRLGPRSADVVVANDNRSRAGSLDGNELRIALELREGTWHPDGRGAVALPVWAIGEEGGAPMIPAPLLRMTEGTTVRASVTNRLGVRAVVRGLDDRTSSSVDSMILAPGESKAVRFRAPPAGTYFYSAVTTSPSTPLSRGPDSQLLGALVVDPRGSEMDDRVFVLTAWHDSVKTPHSAFGPREAYSLNGRSWPATERLTVAEGDTVRWRVINGSQHAHPMHLHGVYFSVLGRGTAQTDTIYPLNDRRSAVTEFMSVATTMSMQWVAERPGNWLFHCHSINHIDTSLRLEEHSGTSHDRVEDAMAGLVMGVTVTPRRGKVRPVSASPRRRIRLAVTEKPTVSGASSFSYIVQEGKPAPARDSVSVPGTPIVLRRGEPSEIVVRNLARHATAVHWHGMELESYYDGVAGWSGSGTRLAPMIAPGDSFVVRITPPRAGTFMYHAHADELAQLTGGLYGPLIILEGSTRLDPTDRLLVLGDSMAPHLRGGNPPGMINGRTLPAPIELREGTRHRLRIMGITGVSNRRVRLARDSVTLEWTPVAKDGMDLPATHRVPGRAESRLGAGETLDVMIGPFPAGRLTLDVVSIFSTFDTTRVPVVVRPR